MKTENLNLNINTLDDKILYRKVCKKIKETDDISFKLLGLVPLISGAGIIILLAEAGTLNFWILVMAGIFGKVITYCIYCWEKRDIQTCDTFSEYVEILELKKYLLEKDIHKSIEAVEGPYSLLRNKSKSQLDVFLDLDKKEVLGIKMKTSRWGKTEAETAFYGIVILFWLLLPLMAIVIRIFT